MFNLHYSLAQFGRNTTMNTYQNIMNLITITLCILVMVMTVFLVEMRADIDGQIFELDNLQGREDKHVHDMDAGDQRLLDKINELEKEVEFLKKKEDIALSSEIDRQIKILDREMKNGK